MSQEPEYCTVCDHKIVAGVACDGQPEECPFHALHNNRNHRHDNYAATVDSLTGSEDLDAIRSID